MAGSQPEFERGHVARIVRTCGDSTSGRMTASLDRPSQAYILLGQHTGYHHRHSSGPQTQHSMSTSYRRIDTTDPRRHDKVQALKFPASWSDDSLDLYGFLLSSATMISGMAMVTRLAPLAYMGLLFGLANFAHEKPFQAKKDSASNAAGPVMGLS